MGYAGLQRLGATYSGAMRFLSERVDGGRAQYVRERRIVAERARLRQSIKAIVACLINFGSIARSVAVHTYSKALD